MSTNRRAALIASAQKIVDNAKAASRDLTGGETGEVESLLDQVKAWDTKVKSDGDLIAKLSGAANPTFEDEQKGAQYGSKAGQASGSRWAKSVMGQVNASAGSYGAEVPIVW